MNHVRFACLPTPPYYAVIFSNQRSAADPAGYAVTAQRMMELAVEQPGYLGVESTRDAEGFGITVSYWQDEASIRAWKTHAEHRIAQEAGMERWYEHYETRVAKVERAYSFK